MAVGSGGVSQCAWEQLEIPAVIQQADAQINATLGVLGERKADGEAERKPEREWELKHDRVVSGCTDKSSAAPGRAEC